MNKLLPRLFTCTLVLSYVLTPRESYSQGTPLVKVTQETTTSAANSGSLPITFTRSATIPSVTSNTAPYSNVGESAFDFGTMTGNYYVQSTVPVDGLKNLTAFTLTGWLNARSLTAGSGGNRIISWINNGGEGVDLVSKQRYLRLGVDGWPDFSPAFSNANKVIANASAPAQNWVFFAVSYQSNGQVSFSGNKDNSATLDVTRSYTSPGITGSNIGKLAIGAFNDAMWAELSPWDRMFRGVVDDLREYTDRRLSPTEVMKCCRSAQQDSTPPTAPTNLRATIVNTPLLILPGTRQQIT
ncbi:MAG: hypothetical protein QM762_09665 [Chryseolinea sp.]